MPCIDDADDAELSDAQMEQIARVVAAHTFGAAVVFDPSPKAVRLGCIAAATQLVSGEKELTYEGAGNLVNVAKIFERYVNGGQL
jgi:hypothetical protein